MTGSRWRAAKIIAQRSKSADPWRGTNAGTFYGNENYF
jgi:hypothetical protein